MALNAKEQTLEKGAIFVANWFQMNEESIDDEVMQHLDMAAELVNKHIQQEYKVRENYRPSHCILAKVITFHVKF